MTASYRLLSPHWLDQPGVVLATGTVVTEGAEVPIGWMPSAEVEPLNSDAVAAFFAAGPFGTTVFPLAVEAPLPSVYWVEVAGHAGAYVLTGAGAALGVKAIG